MRCEGIDRTSGDLRAGQTAALGLCVEPVELGYQLQPGVAESLEAVLGLCVGLVELGYQLQPGVAESLEAGLELGVERASV